MRKKLKDKWITKTPVTRLYNLEKPIIGLTGGIATGKSTVTHILKNLGFEILDADLLVKEIYATKEAKNFIAMNFPQSIHENKINFPKLREIFFASPQNKNLIESFIYSKLPEMFKKHSANIKQNFIIYDVPLLFEKKLNLLCDLSICVYVPSDIQINRLIKRDKISHDLAIEILKQQMPIEEKKEKSDFIITNVTEDDFSLLTNQLEDLILNLFEDQK